MRLTAEVRAIAREIRNKDPNLAGLTEEQIAEWCRLAIGRAIAKTDDPELTIMRLLDASHLDRFMRSQGRPA